MKYVKFIYNPKAGDKTISTMLDQLIDIYQSNGLRLIPERLVEDYDLAKSLEEIDEKFDHILLAGGDGTINGVVSAIVKAGLDIPIGILPAGTANDFSKIINPKVDYLEVAKDILNSKPIEIDLGKANDKYFVNVFSSGLFSGVSQNIETEMKNTFGKISYYFAGVGEAINMKEYKMKISSSEYKFDGKAYLVLVFNGRTAGNISLAYKSKVNDGLLDVLIFEARAKGSLIPMIIDLRKGEHLDKNNGILHHFQTRELKIECEEDLTTDVDGEQGPSYPVNISIEHKKIKVLGIKNINIIESDI